MTGFNLEAIIKNAHFFLLFSMPLLLTSINDIRRFFKLSVATVLIALAGQIYLILTGTSLSYSIFGVSSNYQIVQEYDVEKFLRPTEGSMASFMGIVSGLYLFWENPKKKLYLVLVGLAFLSILITASRGWILATLLIIIPFINKISVKYTLQAVLFFIIIFTIVSQTNVMKTQIARSLDRVSTIELLLEGDLTAGGTLSRVTTRHEVVWNKFLQSPLVGYGYSKVYNKNIDPHVGNQNLLMNVGIIGYSLFLYLIISFLLAMRKVTIVDEKYKHLGILYAFSLLAVFLIHSVSRQMFGYGIDIQSSLIISILFAAANILYYNVGTKKN